MILRILCLCLLPYCAPHLSRWPFCIWHPSMLPCALVCCVLKASSRSFFFGWCLGEEFGLRSNQGGANLQKNGQRDTKHCRGCSSVTTYSCLCFAPLVRQISSSSISVVSCIPPLLQSSLHRIYSIYISFVQNGACCVPFSNNAFHIISFQIVVVQRCGLSSRERFSEAIECVHRASRCSV